MDHIVKKSSTMGLNKAQCYDNEKVFSIWILILCWGFSLRNWMVYKKYQYFVFEAARPGVVKAQLVANGAFTEYNLLKTRKASVSEITKEIKYFSILVLISPPLDYKRQESLYHNIRPFVRDEFKDITCPRPTYIYTDNE